MKSPTPYKRLLTAAVNQRKRLIRFNQNKKDEKRLSSIIMYCEDKLNRFPSEQSVKEFIRNHYEDIMYLIPAKSKDDARIQQLEELIS